jgi:pyridoxine kinase
MQIGDRNNMRQKRIALINDLTGFGRCSIASELPIISALKVQACPLPTALLSVHTGFASHYLVDCTEHMRPYIDNWQENRLEFDGICTGFLSSVEQIDIVIDFIQRFRAEKTQVIFDPVMGDYGKLYSSYTTAICDEMRRLLTYADTITPNLTEACELLCQSYPSDGGITEAGLLQMAEQLSAKGPKQVIITGLEVGAKIGNYVYERNKEPQMICSDRIGGNRSGTGDVFVAILSACLVKGEPLVPSVQKAVDFIVKVLGYTEQLGLPWNAGLAFEEYLTDLK